MNKKAALVIAGSLQTLTGGYVYDRRLVEELESAGWSVEVISLTENFPNPSEAELDQAGRVLAKLSKGVPVIIDGLVFGALSTDIVRAIPSPIIALVHHPLAEEGGLAKQEKKRLFESELANLQFAKTVITPSEQVAGVLSERYRVSSERIRIAEPGLDRASTVGQKSKPPMLLSVGIQIYRKGHDLLLEALSKISELDWQAVIVGPERDKNYAQRLRSLRAELALESRVQILPEVSREKIIQLYSEASVFALATRNEGYGMVFDEAMSFGLPIVTCDVGAVSETVGEDAAVLVSKDSADEIAKALERLVLDSELRQNMSNAALAKSNTKTSWRETADIFTRVMLDQSANDPKDKKES